MLPAPSYHSVAAQTLREIIQSGQIRFFCNGMQGRAAGGRAPRAEGGSWGLCVSPLEGCLGSITSFENTLFSLFRWSHTGPTASSGSPERTALCSTSWPSWPLCPQLVPESQLSAGTEGREAFSLHFSASPSSPLYLQTPPGRSAWDGTNRKFWGLATGESRQWSLGWLAEQLGIVQSRTHAHMHARSSGLQPSF